MMAASTRSDDDLLEQLLEVIYRQYHYDFRSYSRASLRRSLSRAQSSLGVAAPGRLVERVAADPKVFADLLRFLTIQVSDFFRDPPYYRVFREKVVPHLATYAAPKIWVAGCGTGEEAYSIAIVLHEEGLLERSLIYATDIDAVSLETARAGAYDAKRTQAFSANYGAAGGRGSFSEYHTLSNAQVRIVPELTRHIVFSDHSLATDSVFAEVQMVSCRNVLIYFDEELQHRTVQLFRDAMCPRGFLGLGHKESLSFSRHAAAFESCADHERVYRLKRVARKVNP